MKAFLERATTGGMNHFLQEEKQKKTLTNSHNGYTSKSVAANHITVPSVLLVRTIDGSTLPIALFPNTHDVSKVLTIRLCFVRLRPDHPKFPFRTARYQSECLSHCRSYRQNHAVGDAMQNRALDPMHPVAFFDTIRIKIRNTGDVVC